MFLPASTFIPISLFLPTSQVIAFYLKLERTVYFMYYVHKGNDITVTDKRIADKMFSG